MWIECQQSLPESYRWHEFLAFHGRDVQQRSELLQVPEQRLFKALIWHGKPALLVLQWNQTEVEARLHVPGEELRDVDVHQQKLQAMLQRMLGLAAQCLAAGPRGACRTGAAAAAAKRPACTGIAHTLRSIELGHHGSADFGGRGRQSATQADRSSGLAAGCSDPATAAGGAHLLAYPGAAQVAALDVDQLRALSFPKPRHRPC